MEDVPEGKDFSFPREEESTLKLWEELDAFKESVRRSEGKPEYVFYDGPPFATGLPHYGHILAGTIKDIVTRYWHMKGHHVVRRFGWDCHGLPVEYEIDQKLGIKTKDDVMKIGIAAYNEECRSIVMRYSKEWEAQVTRCGRWIDFANDYKTLDPSFMESVWWVFKQLYEKGLVYRGFKVMPYSTRCNTPLSNFEAGLNYKDVSDPAVMVSFPVRGDPDGASLVAWTTTPWTLPSNVALCVHPEFAYLKLKLNASGAVYIVAKARAGELPGAKKDKKNPNGGYTVISECPGAELVGTRYEPLFPYFEAEFGGTGFRVVSDTYVTDDSGTGIVHQAPAYGEDDYRVCLAHGVVAKGEGVPSPVDDNGNFVEPVSDFKGVHVKEADKAIIEALKAKGRLVNNARLVHSYPFCWRSDTPLIYKAVPSWFVGVEEIKPTLLKCNEETYWVPGYVQEKRFKNWLEGARDWAISRNRYWGTPIPIWANADFSEVKVVGSIAELEQLTGRTITDIHRHFIDDLEIPSSTPGGAPLKRVDEVFDCWFESGSMPYAQQHYPFENKESFEGNFPADFIAEGLDQTRGWFYTLMVLSTALFGKPAFKNLICNGLVLAADGKKMSKRLKNYPPPTEVIDEYGADALRLYLINSPVVRAEPMRFKKEGVFGVVKDVFLPWYNAYRFMQQSAARLSSPAFAPDLDAALASANVMDRWIISSTQSLVAFVSEEMGAYRLYTVVPRLLSFIEDLTNVYVRFNRKRLKGQAPGQADADCRAAVSTLFHVLLTVAKVMSPFTPFFTEKMFQNLRRALPEGERATLESVHYAPFPEPIPGIADARIERSVARMTTVINLARTLREKHNLPIKSRPLRRMVVVHPDGDFLQDITEVLGAYVSEELAVRGVEGCADTRKYATLRAEPEFSVLGKRLGKEMGKVGGAIKKMSADEVAAFEDTGAATVAGHELGRGDIKVLREFRPPEGEGAGAWDALGDGDVLVVLNLESDAELLREGLAREVVNRVQKMRKKAALLPSDAIVVFYAGEGEGLRAVFAHQKAYLEGALGVAPLPEGGHLPPRAVPVAQETHALGEGADAESVTLTIARPTCCVDAAAMAAAAGGDEGRAAGMEAYLASLSPARLDAAAPQVTAIVDGQRVVANEGKEWFRSAAARAAATQGNGTA